MKEVIAIISLALFFGTQCSCSAGSACCAKKAAGKIDSQKEQTCVPNEIDEILARLAGSTTKLNSYQAEIRYLFVQDPELLDTRTLRKGQIYYLKDKDGSRLRLSFQTRRQDDDEEQKYRQEYIFDGLWLVKIDYQFQRADFYQQARPDKPKDAFEFISDNFPIVGFSGIENLRKNFQIQPVLPGPGDPNNSIGLHLEPKKGSEYKDKYKMVELWIDRSMVLPVRIVAYSTESDIYDIQFLEPRVNKNLKKSVFKVETPADFSKNMNPLKEQ